MAPSALQALKTFLDEAMPACLRLRISTRLGGEQLSCQFEIPTGLLRAEVSVRGMLVQCEFESFQDWFDASIHSERVRGQKAVKTRYSPYEICLVHIPSMMMLLRVPRVLFFGV
jgi:hypothetical protein